MRVIDLPVGNGRFTLPRSRLGRLFNHHQTSFFSVAERNRVALLMLQQFLASVRSFQHNYDLGPLKTISIWSVGLQSLVISS